MSAENKPAAVLDSVVAAADEQPRVDRPIGADDAQPLVANARHVAAAVVGGDAYANVDVNADVVELPWQQLTNCLCTSSR